MGWRKSAASIEGFGLTSWVCVLDSFNILEFKQYLVVCSLLDTYEVGDWNAYIQDKCSGRQAGPHQKEALMWVSNPIDISSCSGKTRLPLMCYSVHSLSVLLLVIMQWHKKWESCFGGLFLCCCNTSCYKYYGLLLSIVPHLLGTCISGMSSRTKFDLCTHGKCAKCFLPMLNSFFCHWLLFGGFGAIHQLSSAAHPKWKFPTNVAHFKLMVRTIRM